MKKRRICSWLLVFVITVSMISVNAFANEFEISENSLFEDDSDDSDDLLFDGENTEVPEYAEKSDAFEIVGEDWTCPDEIVISGENIEVQGGKYSYKLIIRSNGTLTFDNDLEVYYQGINGRYQLNYEIDETDNHIMIVTGIFENIIIASPLLEKLSDERRDWILTHISADTYFYQLNLRTEEGFSFTNILSFLYDSEPYGYSVNYVYDLQTNKQQLIIFGIADFIETEPAAVENETVMQTGEPAVAENETVMQTGEPAVMESETVMQASKPAANKFAIKNTKRTVKAGNTTAGAKVLNKGTGTKTYKIKAVNKKKYAKYFKINKKTGEIRISKKIPKGKYVVTVQAKAAKTKKHKASGWKTAKVTITVK